MATVKTQIFSQLQTHEMMHWAANLIYNKNFFLFFFGPVCKFVMFM